MQTCSTPSHPKPTAASLNDHSPLSHTKKREKGRNRIYDLAGILISFPMMKPKTILKPGWPSPYPADKTGKKKNRRTQHPDALRSGKKYIVYSRQICDGLVLIAIAKRRLYHPSIHGRPGNNEKRFIRKPSRRLGPQTICFPFIIRKGGNRS